MKKYAFCRNIGVAFYLASILFLFPKTIFAMNEMNDLSRAYGFYVGQETYINLCTQKCPTLENDFRRNAFEFNIKFGKAIKNIEKELKSLFEDKWPEYNENLSNQMNSYIQENPVNCDICKQFVELVKERSEGEMPPSILKVYLQNNPKYIENPELEVADSFFGEYKTEGEQKSLGIKLGVAYPLSWTPKDARAPHIVKKFVGLDLDNKLPQCLVFVNKLPLEIEEEMKLFDKDKVVEMWSSKDFIEESFKDTSYISSGKTKIAGQPTSWVKFSNVQELPTGKIHMCMIIYNILYNQYIVQLQYGVSDIQNNSEQGAIKAMEKYEMLFKLLASKLYIYNKFDY